MLHAGIVSVTFRSQTPQTIVEWTREAGLSGVEWGGDVHVPPGDRDRAREVGRLTRDAGLNVVAYGSYYRFGEVFGEDGPSFQAVLETAAELEAPVLRVWAGRRGSGDTTAEERSRLVRLAREHGDAAAELGITLAFEYHRGTLTDTDESATALLREIDHANVRSLWQPPNGRSPEHCLTTLENIGPWLEHIHCFHWGPEGNTDRLPLADGARRWLRYLAKAHAVAVNRTPRPSGGADAERAHVGDANAGSADAGDGDAAGAQAAVRPLWVLMEFVPDDSRASLERDAAVLLSWVREINQRG